MAAAAQPDNYIVQTLCVYSNNANTTEINGNIYIDTLHSLLLNAIDADLLKPTDLDIPENQYPILKGYMNLKPEFKPKMIYLLNHYHTCVHRAIINILAPKIQRDPIKNSENKTEDQIKDVYIGLLNSWVINNPNKFSSNIHYFYYSPNTIFVGLKQLIDQALVDDSPRQLTEDEVNTIINQTYDYVILLFTVCLAVNFEMAKSEILRQPPSLSQSNHMIISFLNIFLAYFTPLLNELQTQNIFHVKYKAIIDHINWIIGLHNGARPRNVDDAATYNPLNTHTTYHHNFSKTKGTSEQINIKADVSNTHDKSYDLLDDYNVEIIKLQRTNNPISYSDIFTTATATATTPNIRNINLTPTPGHNHAQIYMPEIQEDAKYQSILSKKLGLTQPEIERVLRKMYLNMCRNQLELSNTKTQFKITGIPFNPEKYIYNYLWYFTHTGIKYGDNPDGFGLLEYFKFIYEQFKEDIQKFRILTAINRHTDIINLCKVGSFGFHTNELDISEILGRCDKPYGILLGATAIDKEKTNLKSINGAHRVMLIVDYKDYPADPADPTSEKVKKIYYFEPFGNYFPVFDISGRIIPHIQEMVISQELGAILNTTPAPRPELKKFQIVLPLVDNKTPAYNSLFNISIIPYLGETARYKNYKLLDTVINSTHHTTDKKTLDWMEGYCGLLVLFMALLIKLNCILPQPGNRLNIDDIFLWFNHFNSDPMRTYDNLLSRFILRGFAKVVEDILANKQSQINTVRFDLDKLQEQFSTTIENKQIIPELYTQSKFSQKKALKVLGVVPKNTPDDISNKMNALAMFMIWVANDKYIIDKRIDDQTRDQINYDQTLFDKLQNSYNRNSLSDEEKPITNISLGTTINVLKTAIGNKLRTQKRLKYKSENREKLFKVVVRDPANTKEYHFNPDFGKIIFMDLAAGAGAPVAAAAHP